MHGGYSEVHGNCIKMLLKTSEIQIAIVKEKHNLPVVFDSFVSPKAKRSFASTMHSSTCHTRLNELDFFNNQDLRICTPLGVTGHDHYTNFSGSCVGISNNKNRSTPQKELLKWHWKLGISMYRIQEMMREWHYEEPNGNKTILPAIIKPKYASARNCIVPPCQLCLIARPRKCTPNISRTHLLEDREGAITRDKYNVGDFVSTDQFICKTPVRRLDVCRPGMDENHKIAIIKEIPSLMMQHVAEPLAEVSALPVECTLQILEGFTKCSVNIFRQTFSHLLVSERLRQLRTLSCMSLQDSSCLVGIKKLCKEANDMFNSLNVSKEWNIPQKHRTDACFNCGDPDHGVPKCPKPLDQARIDKAKSEFSEN